MKYDIIGDVHGHADELIELLNKLGYTDKSGSFKHPASDRKAIFVGDFIDRGPQIKETLEIVKSMVDDCAALAVLGNHEYNALCFHTKTAGRSNAWLRPRNDKNIAQHIETLYQFREHLDKWKDYLAWFMTLPLFLDLGDIRIVHAAWIKSEINKIERWTLESHRLSKSLLQRSAMEGCDEFDAIETVLKGVEIWLPKEQKFEDKDENPREEIRIQWWNPAAKNLTYEELLFPRDQSQDFGNERIKPAVAATLPMYKDSVPVFFGHYWIENSTPGVQKENICCLDYSVANGGSLVAYTWRGEKALRNDHFSSV